MRTQNKQPKGTIRKLFTIKKVYNWAYGAWTSINQRTINGLYKDAPSIVKNKQQKSYLEKGIEIHLDKMDFFRWVANQESIVDSIYSTGLKPNIDRIDDKGNYSLDNMQIISNIENCRKKRLQPKKLSNKDKYGEIYNIVMNRRAYIKNMGIESIRPGPFDVIIMNLPIKDACRVIEQSREELKTELTNQEKEGN